MKKVLFGLFIFILLIGNVYAFESTFYIDVDKIEITAKSDNLIKGLDKSYDIETPEFSNDVVENKEVENLTKKLIKISLANKSINSKQKDFSEYLYIDKNNGVNSLTSSLFIETYLKSLSEHKIEYDYIKVIRLVEFEKGLLAFAYMPDANVDGLKKDFVITFWFVENEGEYQVHFAWFNFADELEDYFNSLGDDEKKGDIIGGSYKNISLSGKSQDTVNDELLTKLYNDNIASSYQITGMSLGGNSVYGSAFVIRSGVVLTTWSLFIQFLSSSDFLYVNDNSGNTYIIEGIVAADTDYDVILLKLGSEVGQEVKLGDSSTLNLDDKVFTINSKINSGFSINYGSYVSTENGKIKNLFAISSSDVGSALYNINGEVIGFNTADVVNSDLSYANSTNYLRDLQNILKNTSFEKIKAKSLDSFKEMYYQPLEKEKNYSNLKEQELDDFLELHNLKNTISLPLIKSSYKDGILSLRYKNNSENSLGTMYFINDYVTKLKENGYKKTYDELDKKIYKNKTYQVIIKERMSYLIILIVEV